MPSVKEAHLQKQSVIVKGLVRGKALFVVAVGRVADQMIKYVVQTERW